MLFAWERLAMIQRDDPLAHYFGTIHLSVDATDRAIRALFESIGKVNVGVIVLCWRPFLTRRMYNEPFLFCLVHPLAT
jgi:hypothetical protein